jgi:hypothetical protein
MSANGGSDTNPERWRGIVDERLRRLSEESKSTGTNVTKLFDKVETLQNQVTRLIVYVGLGAFFGSAIVSVVVGVVIKIIAH